ncbi:MAG: insulinase family protein [Desulfomonile sp.]|nr:insulinase family protein [Desulfomonile sp.]
MHVCQLSTLLKLLPLPAMLLGVPLHAAAMEGKFTSFTCPNGLQVFIQEDHARKVASIQIWVMVGSADETDRERGISHLIEHMAFKGTQRRGLGQIAQEVEGLGGDMNAYTSWDETVFHVTVPSSATTEGLDILLDAVFNPVIDPAELAKEIEVVLEEILEGEERPERKASKLLFGTAYTASPYRYPIIGYREIVEKITREDVLAFRKKWYVPENMFVVVTGDVDPDKVKADIERLTADIKPTGFFRPPRPEEPGQESVRGAVLRDTNAREARLHLAFHIPGLSGYDVGALDLAADILGARESSRLVRVIKKEKQLVNTITAYCLTPKRPGIFVVSATLQSKNLEAATQAIMDEIALLGKETPPGDELERARIGIESEHLYARETVDGIARSIGGFYADAGDAEYERKYLRLIATVSPQEVSRVAQRYLLPPNATVTALVPAEELPDFTIDRLTRIVESFPRAQIAAGATSAAEGVLTRTLQNGIRVVLVPDDTNPIVSFRVACLGGKRFETKDTEGMMNFIAQMLNKGAGTLTEVDIAQRIEDMGGKLKGFSGFDSFGLSTTIFSRFVDEGLQLLAEVYKNPSFPKDKMERERALILNRIKTEPDRPTQYAVKVLNETLFQEHPYGFDKEGTIPTVSGFTPDDLAYMYKQYAVPANTVITGVGDMDGEKTMNKIAELFGSIETRPLEEPSIPGEAPLDSVRENVIRIPRAKAHIVIGFRGCTLKDQDRYPLAVLNNVLAGQGGRLFVELRDRQSLAYVVTSFMRPGMDPGSFALYIACDESKVDQATKGLLQEIERVRAEQVAEEELQRSITNLVGNHRISLQSSWSRAESIALNTLYGLGYDYDERYVRKIAAVTAVQLLDVARRYLDPSRCAIVKILPEQNAQNE